MKAAILFSIGITLLITCSVAYAQADKQLSGIIVDDSYSRVSRGYYDEGDSSNRRIINFAGRDWYVRSGYGGPGPNNWSDSSSSVWVDGDGVHLWTDSKFKNLQVDAMHAFYATHSSTRYLVTNDKNMIMKSKLAYLCLGLPIQVVCFSDFATILSAS